MPEFMLNIPWGIMSFVCFGAFAAVLIVWLLFWKKKKAGRILLVAWILLLLIGVLTAFLDVSTFQEKRKKITDNKLSQIVISIPDTLGQNNMTIEASSEEYSTATTAITTAEPEKVETADELPQPLVIYDENDIRITYKNAERTRTGAVDLNILMENNSDTTVKIIPMRFYTNGFLTTVGGAWEIFPGKKANKAIEIYASELRANDINMVECVEFEISIYPDGGERIVSERISIDIEV